MEASGSHWELREAFSNLASVPGSPIPLHRNCSFEQFLGCCGGGALREVKFTTVSHFSDFDIFNASSKLPVLSGGLRQPLRASGNNRGIGSMGPNKILVIYGVLEPRVLRCFRITSS